MVHILRHSSVKMGVKKLLLLLFLKIYVAQVHVYEIEDVDNCLMDRRVNSTTQYIEQQVNHFNSSDKRTFQMRYYEIRDHFKSNGPIYLSLYGFKYGMNCYYRFLTDLAKETNGIVIGPEHRYEGDSSPFPYDVTTDNLKYLTSALALADLKKLVQTLKEKPEFKASKVVAAGSDTGGRMAVWLKATYPDDIVGAIAEGAPLLAKANYEQYLPMLSSNYRKYGTKGCANEINNIFSEYTESFKTPSGIKTLKRNENICKNNDMTNSLNQTYFVVYNLQFYTEPGENYPESIKSKCSELVRYAELPGFCLVYSFDDNTKTIREKGIGIEEYIKCTELGHFYTSNTNSKDHDFSNMIDMEYNIKLCTGVFGPEFNEKRLQAGVDATNKLYGGKKPNVSNVVFVSGLMDPWRGLSVLEDLSPDSPAFIIEDVARGKFLLPLSKSDPPQLINTRLKVKEIVKKWL